MGIWHKTSKEHRYQESLAEHYRGRASRFTIRAAVLPNGPDRDQWLIAARRQRLGGYVAMRACSCRGEQMTEDLRTWRDLNQHDDMETE